MKVLLAALFLLQFAACATALEDESVVRAEFIAALQKTENDGSVGKDTAALRTYVLYPYLQSARLQQQLKRTPNSDADASIREFLLANGKAVATRELTRSWLQSLAQRQQWAAFNATYREDIADTDLRCQKILARANGTRDAALRDDALKLWLTGQQLSATCIPAFDWIKQQGWLTPDLLEQRTRLALESGNTSLAESLIQELSPVSAMKWMRWVRLIRAPQAELELIIEEDKVVEADALLDGYTRLGRKDAPQALKLYKPLLRSQKLKDKEAEPFTSVLALSLATSRLPEALTYFQKLPETAVDDKLREWRLRAALWKGNWPLVRQWSRQLPNNLATSDRWTYWHARGLEKSRKAKKQALTLYQALSLKNNLYGVLAAQQLGRPHIPQPFVLALDAEQQKKLMQLPAVIRAHELYRVGREDWASQEWNATFQGSSAPTREQAGLLASSWGWHAQAISTLASVLVYDNFDATYPIVYEPQVETAAKLAALAPKVVYGVMRQESLFDPLAVSPANAYGLMQLLLPTARNVARRWKLPEPSQEDLFNPELNLELGAAYLHELVEKWNGNLVLALGSYNAGPNAVARWLPDKPMDADIWIENIPYTETRGYIQRILWHICVFGWRQSGEAQDLSPLLKPISRPAP